MSHIPFDPASPRSALHVWGADDSLFQQLSYFQSIHGPSLQLGRVLCVHRGLVDLVTLSGPARVRPPRHEAGQLGPGTGDWVVFDPLRERILEVVARRTALVRQSAGNATVPQLLAANVDTVFVVTSANEDFSQRRLERYRVAIAQSGAQAMAVLSKVDLVDENERQRLIGLSARVLPTVSVCAHDEHGLDELMPFLQPGATYAFIGSSGVGKSTLVNRLLGEDRQEVLPLRSDDTGRHTTTRRELVLMASGAILLDTPGLREVRLWAEESGPDERLVHLRCRFADCTHRDEPGCAIIEAVERGEIEVETLATLHDLERELAYQARRQDERLARAERDRWKRITKDQRAHSRTSMKR